MNLTCSPEVAHRLRRKHQALTEQAKGLFGIRPLLNCDCLFDQRAG
jgi:hypothetical protein